MNGLYTIILLITSNIFMTLAWYGHLRLQQSGASQNWPLIDVSGAEPALEPHVGIPPDYLCGVSGIHEMRDHVYASGIFPKHRHHIAILARMKNCAGNTDLKHQKAFSGDGERP